jgi:mycothiol synthase
VRGPLDVEQTQAVAQLVERATQADDARPLSEHVSLHLRYGGDAPVRNLLLVGEGDGDRPDLAGYAHLDVTDVVAGSSAELVVDPAWRRRGVGRALLSAVVDETPDGRLRLWAHGEHPAAAQLAAAMGFTQVRQLLQMRRSLFAPLPGVQLPDGYSVRTFRVGQDESAWLALNARAFAGHPEQGQWTREDLDRRLAEPWFDPDGFFLAEHTERDGRRDLVGFHWTKVHGGRPATHEHDDLGRHRHDDHGHEPIGEVYVVGVDPDAQGLGLGRALTIVGLQHLRSQGLTEAMLYVESDNRAAIHVYESLGFTRWSTDVMFQRGPGPPAPAAG